MLRSSGPGQVLGSYVSNRVSTIRLVQWLGWVFENKERKKEEIWPYPSQILEEEKRNNFFPGLILPIKPRMHICPCSWSIEISKKIWIQKYFGPVTVDSAEFSAFLRFGATGPDLPAF